ncbi:MAG TPA: rhodanese-like domain-containing protein [Gammaproteobacteria bacterium]|nr:rhodanese-like domain-containing protein [Gammaproteobacteria bacterium]
MSPTEVRRRLTSETERGETILLDVREPEELAAASLPEALHIPMREVPARLAELPQDKTIVVMCHGGMRSARVTAFLMANGFEDVYNLRGGIDAWSVEVDPKIPRY